MAARRLLIVMLVALLVSIVAAATAGLSWGRVIVQLLLPILLIGQIGLFILHDALGGTQQNPIPSILGLHALNGLLMTFAGALDALKTQREGA